MKSLYDFIIQPIGDRYANSKKIGKKDLILIEKVQNEKSMGKDQNFLNVLVNEKIKEGDIVACIYTGVNNDMLMAKRI